MSKWTGKLSYPILNKKRLTYYFLMFDGLGDVAIIKLKIKDNNKIKEIFEGR